MKRGFTICAIMLCLICSAAHAGSAENDEAVRILGYESFKRVLMYSIDKTMLGEYKDSVVDPGGLIVLLADIDSVGARKILLQLTEVYIGEATGEALNYAVVKQDKAIEEDLRQLLEKDVECGLLKESHTYVRTYEVKKIRCKTRESRDRKIKWLLEMIEEGRELEYVL